MKIQSNFTVPPDVNDPNLTCVLEWEITPDGTIRNIRVVKSTGVPRLDACALDALRKTENLGPLPPEWGNRSVWTSLTFVFAGDQPITIDEPAAPTSANPLSPTR
jgi:TonB family protein